MIVVALCCPGPSLAQTYAVGDHDYVVAVNRAILFADADWWAFADYQTFIEVVNENHGHPPGNVYTSAATLQTLSRKRGLPSPRKPLSFDEVRRPLPTDYAGINWPLFTATAALVLCRHLGAERIDVYGADWTQQPDYDGQQTQRAVRSPSRWERERAIWNALTERLTEEGVAVHRHLPPPPPPKPE